VNIGIPRFIIVGMAALFSLYHVILALYSLSRVASIWPVVIAIIVYATATTVSLLPWSSVRMPIWMASFNLAATVVITLLVTSVLDPHRDDYNIGGGTWYVAALGTLLTITSTRRRHGLAWAGMAFLAIHTVVWAGPGALASLGVIGSISWVAVSHILSSGMLKATKDALRFALAEREATDWQAAQEAHVFERQFRLGQTSSSALPMLRRIQASGGELTEEERRECLYLEGAIRDEIRGRKLLNDAVREQVMIARRRGAIVTLLDEGGLDELSESELGRVHRQLADAISSTSADTVIVRTAADATETAVTVVGLRSATEAQDGVQDTHEDDEVDIWLEIRATPSGS
jgi:hypothetical protein